MLAYRDVKYKCANVSYANNTPMEFLLKIFARSDQSYVLDTGVNIGSTPNLDFWNVHFWFGAEIMDNPGVDVIYYYRDVIELLYDGLEPKY